MSGERSTLIVLKKQKKMHNCFLVTRRLFNTTTYIIIHISDIYTYLPITYPFRLGSLLYRTIKISVWHWFNVRLGPTSIFVRAADDVVRTRVYCFCFLNREFVKR